MTLALIVLRRRENDPGALSVLATAVVPVLVAALLLPKASRPCRSRRGAGWSCCSPSGWLAAGGRARLAPAGLAGLLAILQATVTQRSTARPAPGCCAGRGAAAGRGAVGGRNRLAPAPRSGSPRSAA